MLTTPGTKKAIVLSGGGARGAFEAGVLAELSKRTSFDIVCGTSIGAINASLTAQHGFAELAELWQTIASKDVIQYVELVQKVNSFVDDFEGLRGKPLSWVLNFHLVNDWFKIGSKKAILALRGIVDPGPIEDLLKPLLSIDALKSTLIVSATNLTNGTSDAFYSFVNASNDDIARFKAARAPDPSYPLSDDNYLSVIRASAAIPGAFVPIEMNLGDSQANHDYVDGGVANNTPISLAIDAGATEIFVVFLDPTPSARNVNATQTLYDIGMASLTVMQQRILELDMRFARSCGGVTIKELRPTKPISVSVLASTMSLGLEMHMRTDLRLVRARLSNPSLARTREPCEARLARLAEKELLRRLQRDGAPVNRRFRLIAPVELLTGVSYSRMSLLSR